MTRPRPSDTKQSRQTNKRHKLEEMGSEIRFLDIHTFSQAWQHNIDDTINHVKPLIKSINNKNLFLWINVY